MKLYATVTSERASKGQGGQSFLSLDIRNAEAVLLAGIVIKPAQGAYPISIEISDESHADFLRALKNKIAFTLDKMAGKFEDKEKANSKRPL